MKSIVIALTVALAALTSAAEIKLLTPEYDFGLMKEIAGPATGTATFLNAGSEPVSIIEVKPSCGCTSATFDDSPIPPGKKSVISFTYDPAMRPGKFLKTVKVRFSDGTRKSVTIKGNVLGTPESLAQLYPADAGKIKLSETALNFGEVTFGRTITKFVNAYILSPDSLAPSYKAEGFGISINPSSRKGGPGDIITCSVIFDSRKAAQFGPIEIPLTFSDNSGSPEYTLPVRAYVIPDSEALLRMQQGKNPVCDITPDIIDLGNISAEANLNYKISIKNSGKAPLNILRMFADTDAVKLGKIPSKIKSGKTGTTEIEIDTTLLPKGPSKHLITVISDDPYNPVLTIPLSSIKQ